MPSTNGVTRLATREHVAPAPLLGVVGRVVRAEDERRPAQHDPEQDGGRGMCSAVMIAANAGGKPMNRTTTTRISQTWFASQIGPIARAISSRCSRARGPEANRSQTPPPKSAPPSRT